MTKVLILHILGQFNVIHHPSNVPYCSYLAPSLTPLFECDTAYGWGIWEGTKSGAVATNHTVGTCPDAGNQHGSVTVLLSHLKRITHTAIDSPQCLHTGATFNPHHSQNTSSISTQGIRRRVDGRAPAYVSEIHHSG